MATYIFSGTTDLDNVFEPRGNFSKRANVGIYSNTTDISNLYAPVSHGSPAGNTGIYSGTTDIGQLFAAKGSVVYWDGSLGDLPSSETDSGSGGSGATVGIYFYPDGEIRTRQNFPFEDRLIGHWAGQVADSSNTEIRFVLQSGSLEYNSATSFQSMTDIEAFSVFAQSSTNLDSQSATVRVELQKNGDSGTRVTSTITISALHGNPA